MLTYWLIQHLDPDWKVAHKLWSIRVALFWMLVMGAYMALPAFQDWMPAPYFAGLCIFGTLTIGIARLTNQPGVT
jgi:hypothetical protein